MRAFKYFNKKVDGFYKTVDEFKAGNKGWDFYENPIRYLKPDGTRNEYQYVDFINKQNYTTMKNVHKFVLVFLYILLSSSSCEEVGIDGHKEVTFKNKSNKTIFISGIEVPRNSTNPQIDCLSLGRVVPPQGEYVSRSSERSFEEDVTRINSDPVCYFIFNEDIDYSKCNEDYISEYTKNHLKRRIMVDEAFIEQMNKDNWTIVYEETEEETETKER